MDTDQWPQEMGLLMKPHMEGAVMPSAAAAAAACSSRAQLVDRRPRPQKEHALNCPRCQSTNTKFCYYNNYSLSQPRYFCKTCRRYWTEGGSLRNVPVGGGSRKNKRSSSGSSALTTVVVPSLPSAATTAKTKLPDPAPPCPVSSATTTTPPSPKFQGGHDDLNQLAFSRSHLKGDFGEYRTTENAHGTAFSSTASPAAFGTAALSAIELLRGGISARGALISPFMPVIMPTQEASADYPASGFRVRELIRSGTLGFPLDGVGADGRYGVDVRGAPDDGRRAFFPGEDLRQVPSADIDVEHARAHGGGDPWVFWNGEMGGGVGGSW